MRSRPRWTAAHRRPRPFLTEFIFGVSLKFLIKNPYENNFSYVAMYVLKQYLYHLVHIIAKFVYSISFLGDL